MIGGTASLKFYSRATWNRIKNQDSVYRQSVHETYGGAQFIQNTNFISTTDLIPRNLVTKRLRQQRKLDREEK